MFFEVRVFDARGQLKKIISSKRLSNRFWKLKADAPPEYDANDSKSDGWGNKSGLTREKICVDEEAL
ncbi:MAG: hypothetical protein IID18_03925 [Nitrospinae bacterium]|nr:hypothetical protein [Nitrospinota bacterium]